MKKIKFFPIALLICLLFTLHAPAALALDDPPVSADALVLADARSGVQYFTKNQDWKMYPASLTKVMTALLAVEAVESGEVSPYDEVTVPEDYDFDLEEDGSTASLAVGETLTLENLLYCAMVASANDACNVIAEYVGGSIQNFVKMMNARALELGCKNTQFANTHGLPNDNHYTTAYDFYLIVSEAVSHDLFMEICDTPEITIPATNISAERKFYNSNALICDKSIYGGKYLYEYAAGVKTGYTNSAGYCLASTASKDGVNLIAIVMGAKSYQASDGTMGYGNFEDTIALYEWVFNNFSEYEILSASELVAEVPVLLGADGDSVTLKPEKALKALLPSDTDRGDFDRRITIYSEESAEAVKAPVKYGDVMGEVTVSRDGVVYGTVPLIASASIDLSRGQYIKAAVLSALGTPWVVLTLVALVLFVSLYIFLVIRYHARRRRYLMEARRARAEREREMAEAELARKFRGEPEKKGTPVEYFGRNDLKQEVKIGTGTPVRDATSDKEKRDYFEEFFGKK